MSDPVNVPAPTVGRVIQYAIGTSYDGATEWRPAIVVNDWNGSHGPNVQVFVDGSNDRHRDDSTPAPWHRPSAEECARGIMWRTSVPHGDAPGCWRWPPRS